MGALYAIDQSCVASLCCAWKRMGGTKKLRFTEQLPRAELDTVRCIDTHHQGHQQQFDNHGNSEVRSWLRSNHSAKLAYTGVDLTRFNGHLT